MVIKPEHGFLIFVGVIGASILLAYIWDTIAHYKECPKAKKWPYRHDNEELQESGVFKGWAEDVALATTGRNWWLKTYHRCKECGHKEQID